MATIEVTAEIARPVHDVFAYMTDSNNRPKWDTNMVEMKQTSQGPKGVGTTYAGAYRMMGTQRAWTANLTHFEIDRQVGYSISSGSMHVGQQFTLAESAAGTRVTYSADMQMTGFMRLFGPLMKWSVSSQTRANLRRLKAILEGTL